MLKIKLVVRKSIARHFICYNLCVFFALVATIIMNIITCNLIKHQFIRMHVIGMLKVWGGRERVEGLYRTYEMILIYCSCFVSGSLKVQLSCLIMLDDCTDVSFSRSQYWQHIHAWLDFLTTPRIQRGVFHQLHQRPTVNNH